MKRTILTLFFTMVCLFAFGQTVQSSSIVWVDAGGETSYLIDSTTYDNGKILITRTATLDSSSMASLIVTDTVSATANYTSELASFNSNASRISTFQSAKTIDSLQYVYWLARVTQLKNALDSLIAN